jgi:ZIP family zinc transporter
VSSGQILVLGAVAGLTIFLGLPMGRMHNPSARVRAFLNAIAIGILVFLLWDVLSNAWEPVETALANAQNGHGTWLRLAGLATTFAVCLGTGLLSLVYFDRWRDGRQEAQLRAPRRPFGPGAASVDELRGPATARFLASPAHKLALLIALGIGLHNFSEGLAIGQSGARGEISLALLLIIGFGLHNATEGFGIVAPLAAERQRPTWAFLVAMGLIGGGPTFFGTLIGQSFVNDTLSLAFLALAAGSILYVVVQLLNVAQRLGFKELLMWGLLLGMLLGFGTDLVLKAAKV